MMTNKRILELEVCRKQPSQYLLAPLMLHTQVSPCLCLLHLLSLSCFLSVHHLVKVTLGHSGHLSHFPISPGLRTPPPASPHLPSPPPLLLLTCPPTWPSPYSHAGQEPRLHIKVLHSPLLLLLLLLLYN